MICRAVTSYLHVMSQHQASQAEKITVILILDVDDSPGVFPSSHSLPTLILDDHIAADHGKRYQVVLLLFCLVVGEVVNIYLVFLQLTQDLGLIILRAILKPQNTSVELQLVSSAASAVIITFCLNVFNSSFVQASLLPITGIMFT